MRVLIADDHTVVRQGLRQILEMQPAGWEMGEAVSAQDVLEKVRRDRWDVLVLDLSLPDRNGMEVLEQIRHLQPKLPILVLSMHPEDQYGLRVLRAGASGYMNKESAVEDLAAAVERVAADGRYISPHLAERLVSELREDANRPAHETLSNREYRVLLLLAAGKSIKEISNELTLSAKTVSTYRARLLQKLNLRTNAELVRYAIMHQLT